MPISYPLDLPATPGPVRVVFSAMSSVGLNRSPFTYQTLTQENIGQMWAIDVTLPPMKRETAEPWVAFFLKLNGQRGTFLIGDPASAAPRGTVPGSPLVDGAHAAQSSELSTKGWATSQTGILLAGDYIQVGNRLHKVLDDADSDGSGEATLTIWPRLREALSGDETIITSGARGLFRLSGNAMSLFDVGVDRVYTTSFSAIEAI